MLGYPDQALQRIRATLTLAHEVSHPYSLAAALFGSALVHQLRREGRAAQERAEAAIVLSTEQGFPFFVAGGTIFQGWALAEQGQGEKGIALIREGLTAWRTVGTGSWQPYFLAQLAETYGRVGQPEEGLNVLAEALAVVSKTGERSDEVELYRLKGELTLQSKVQSLKFKVEEEAEACFFKAIEIARQQQAKTLELRAAMSLARLWQRQALEQGARSLEQEGRSKESGGREEQKTRTRLTEAHQMLSEVYSWFTEGFDTVDLKEAKALLDEITNY
jgi:predicted ATPase